MRVAISNAFPGRQVAETELARRLCDAAAALGWDAFEAATSRVLAERSPDFVLALHFFTPKLTPFPTYGCLWNPPSFMESDPRWVRHVLSYDGYLSSSPAITRWLEQQLEGIPKRRFVIPFYPACNRTAFQAPDLAAPRLVYAGTNWDGPRFRELFERLAREPWFDVYGPADRWAHARAAYRGTLPFDGHSLIHTIARAGVGLCLHREEHRLTGTPSLRIFEIAAAGAVAIGQDHPFVREAFGDSILYVDGELDPVRTARQIAEHMRWIRGQHAAAAAMAAEAHAIFSRRFTLEDQLLAVGRAHEEHRLAPPGPARAAPAGLRPRVEYVVRAGPRPAAMLRRALDSLAAQRPGDVAAIVVCHGGADVGWVDDAYRGRLPVRFVQGRVGVTRSGHLWDGLDQITAELFGVLDDDDALHPGHVAGLLAVLDEHPEVVGAYSGSIRVWEGSPLPDEPAELIYGERFDPGRLFALRNYVTSNAFVARSSALRDLPPDPALPLLEDLYLLILLASRGPLLFDGSTSCQFHWRSSRGDNAMLGPSGLWQQAEDRLADLVWGPAEGGDEARRRLRTGAATLLREARHREGLLGQFALTEEERRWRAEAEALREVVRQRDSDLAAIVKSKGWRVLTALRRARDGVREVSASWRARAERSPRDRG